MTDNINPAHYTSSDIECIDAIRAALTPEEFRGYCKGNAIKYVWRERMKGGNESLQKANWYMDKAVSVSTQPQPATPAYPYLAEVGEHMAAKAALREAQEGDGWIEWGGGDMPVISSAYVDIRLRNGKENGGYAGYFGWLHTGCFADIMAYRVATA